MSRAFDQLQESLNDTSKFDDKGMAVKADPVEGDSGTNEPPAPTAEEQPAASQPSPDAATATPTGDAPPAEDKSGAGAGAAKATDDGKAPLPAKDQAASTDDDESEDALKKRFTKPTDTDPEQWRIRAMREGFDLRKKLTPIQSHLDRIASPDRAARGLEFTAVFAEPEIPIADAVAKMTALSSSRTKELVDHFYNDSLDRFPDQVARDLIEDDTVTVQELKEALHLKRGGAQPAGQKDAQPQSTVEASAIVVPKPEGLTDDEWSDLQAEYPEAYKAMQQQLAQQQAAAATPPAKDAKVDEDPTVTKLTTELEGYRTRETQRELAARRDEIDTDSKQIHEQAFSVVLDGLRELGLEPDPAKDDERTIGLKNRMLESLSGKIEAEFYGPDGPEGMLDFSLANDEQRENRKLVVKVIDLLAKRDKKAAFDYVDHLKARVARVFDRIAPAEVEIYNAAMIQPTEKTRNAGEHQHERPEILGGAAAAGLNQDKTPWLHPDFRRKGETPFEAMNRYMESASNLPGRA